MIKFRFPFISALVAVFVFALSSVANAETIPATPNSNAIISWWSYNVSGSYPTPQALCAVRGVNNPGYTVVRENDDIYQCLSATNYQFDAARAQRGSGYICPTGQNWTLSASNCIRADCVAPQVRDAADGVCKDMNPCTPKTGTSAGEGWITSAYPAGDPTGTSCDGSCKVSTSLDLSASGYYTDGKTKTMKYVQTFTGDACTGSDKPQTTPTNKAPTEPPKKPPCLATEGVMTSSTGTIACVPQGSPGSNPPVVTKTKDVQNFPDGSAKTTETTTTRDPATGVEVKNQIVTITPATGGASGAAGTPGTSSGTTEKGTTSGGDPAKPGDSDFCAKNAGLQICKGGIAEEKTQVEIKELQKETKNLTKEIKDILDPDEEVNKDTIEAEKTAYEEKSSAHKDFIDSYGAKGQNDEGFMSWAMLPEVPAGSCAPFTGTIAGKTVTLDWCEQLLMVRDIAGYMFYILTAFGLFRIFSNATGATS